jgi:hypothetical protein
MSRGCSLSRLAVLSLLAALVGGLGAPASGLGASAPRCSTATLRLDLVSEDAATSHRFWNLSLRNTGASTCHLKGFPGVGLLDANAGSINDPVVRQTGFKQRNVVLKPWQRAYFTFGYAVSGPSSTRTVSRSSPLRGRNDSCITGAGSTSAGGLSAIPRSIRCVPS